MSGETIYKLENAKSGRSSCKKCKIKILKNEIRLGVETDGPSFKLQSWYHPTCFTLPRKLVKEKGITALQFVEELLEDYTVDEVCSNDTEMIVRQIEEKVSVTKKEKGGEDGDGVCTERIKKNLARLRKEVLGSSDDDDAEYENQPKKKRKMNKLSEEERAEAEVYAMYEKKKNDELKDVLRWNNQMVGGNKDALLTRIIDGQLNGRLGICPSCEKGKMKLKDTEAAKAYCNGYFDEENQARIPCFYECSLKEAPRLLPWYTEEPSEEEKEKMKAMAEEGASNNINSSSTSENIDAKAKLLKRASKLNWNLDSKSGIKEAAQDLTTLCTKDHLVDVPNDDKITKMEIGRLVVQNRSKTASEVMELVINKFGLTQAKIEKEKKQAKSLSAVCGNAENVGVMQAILELGDLYFKEGNRNAGATYKKVAQAIKELTFEITAENAKGLGKGKTKIANIGKGSAEKMYEFVTTGTIEKLEEKRASAS